LVKCLNKKQKRILICVGSVVLIVAILFSAAALYLSDYYSADNEAIGAFLPQGSSWSEEPDGTIVFEPDNARAGLIFYPGGKVEHTAYIPLMQACSEAGILCILLEMPFNLAVFDINAANGIQEEYPHIERWYIGGHSLGGSMAASYLSDCVNEYEGLILLGSYSTESFVNTDIRVLSVYGSEDKVLNMEKYEKNRKNLPENFEEYIIEGGCHAYFGMYGKQEGDGVPTVTNAEQIKYTASKISQFIEQNKE
jgi:dienelactone hydrolase